MDTKSYVYVIRNYFEISGGEEINRSHLVNWPLRSVNSPSEISEWF